MTVVFLCGVNSFIKFVKGFFFTDNSHTLLEKKIKLHLEESYHLIAPVEFDSEY